MTDIRGNGDSQGIMEDEYTTQELSDAYPLLAKYGCVNSSRATVPSRFRYGRYSSMAGTGNS